MHKTVSATSNCLTLETSRLRSHATLIGNIEFSTLSNFCTVTVDDSLRFNLVMGLIRIATHTVDGLQLTQTRDGLCKILLHVFSNLR